MSVTDLTGTKWLLNESIEYNSSFPTYNIVYNAYCEGGAFTTLTGLYMRHVVDFEISINFYCMRYTSYSGFQFRNFFMGDVLYTGDARTPMTTTMTNSANNPYFNTELFNRTIEITGGTDATNTNLINWLQANATQIIEPQPTDTNKISVGTTKLAKAFIGNTEVASMWLGNVKVYEKASSYDYNYSNGTLTINNAPYNYNNGVLTIE